MPHPGSVVLATCISVSEYHRQLPDLLCLYKGQLEVPGN